MEDNNSDENNLNNDNNESLNDSSYPSKSSTVITAPTVKSDYANGAKFLIYLKDAEGNNLSNKTVFISISGISTVYNVTTDANGLAIFNFKKVPKTYDVVVSFNGDEDYLSSKVSSKIVISKAATSIVAPNVRSYLTQSTYLKVTLKDSKGNAISNRKVILTVGGKKYSLTTDSSGIAKLKFSNKVRNIKVLINFKGDSYYLPSSKTSKVVITKMKTYIEAPSIKSYFTQSNYFTATLKNAYNKGVAKKTLRVTVGKKVYKLTTDSKGVIKLKLKNKYTNVKVLTKFAGNSKYVSSSKTSKVVITKMPVKISAPAIKIKSDKYGSFIISLKDVKNKPLKGKTISVSLPSISKVYKVTTNSSGQAILSINSYKTSSITVKFSGGSKYYSKTVKSTISVTQVKVSFNNAIKASILLRDYVINNKNLPATVSVDGSTYTAAQVSYLALSVIKNVKNKNHNSIVLVPVKAPSKSAGTEIYDTVYKKDYLSLTNKGLSSMIKNHAAPTYLTYSFYKIKYDLYTMAFSRVVGFYKDNNRLPNYRLFTSSEFVKVPNDSNKYTFYLTSDNIAGKKSDTQMLKKLSATLKSMGYDAIIVGVGPDIHNIAYQYGCVGSNSVLLCCFGGVDVGCIEEWADELWGPNNSFNRHYDGAHVLGLWYTKPYGASSSVYTKVGRAWDADYGWALNTPASYMNKHGISYMQTSTVDKACTLLKNHKINGYKLF